MSVNIVAIKSTTLKSPLLAGAFAFTVEAFVDKQGNQISSMAAFGSWFVMVLTQGNTWEQVKCTGFSYNSDGSCAITIDPAGRNILPYPPYAGASSGFEFQVTAGAIVTNDMLTMSILANTQNINTFLATQTFNVVPNTLADPVGNNDLTRKSWVAGLVLGTLTTIDIIVPGLAGETVARGALVYFDNVSNEWKNANASTAAKVLDVKLGIAQGAAMAGNAIPGGIMWQGLDTNQSGLTNGVTQYASNTPGAISPTPGTVNAAIGIAASATTLMFSPFFNVQITSDQMNAMAGKSGSTPNATDVYEDYADTTDGNAVDQSQTTETTGTPFGQANATTKPNMLAQSFIAGKTPITSIDFYKVADVGTFTGSVTFSIQADNAGKPSGTALATATISNGTYEALSIGDNVATFGAPYIPTLGKTYWIVAQTSTADNSNYPNLGINTAGGYSGQLAYNNTTDGWVNIATSQLYFKVNISIAGKLARLVGTQLPSSLIPAVYMSYTYGETIAAFAAVYLNPTDGKVYNASASAVSALLYGYFGMTTTAGTVGQSLPIVTGGVLSGMNFGAATTAISKTQDFGYAGGNNATFQEVYTGHASGKQIWTTGAIVGNLSEIDVYIAQGASGAGILTLNVYPVTPTVTGFTYGASLGSSTVTGPIANALNSFTFATPIAVTPNTMYAWELTAASGSSSNYWELPYDTTGTVSVPGAYNNFNDYNSTLATPWDIARYNTYYTSQQNYTIGDLVYLQNGLGLVAPTTAGANPLPIGRILSSSSMILERPRGDVYLGSMIFPLAANHAASGGGIFGLNAWIPFMKNATRVRIYLSVNATVYRYTIIDIPIAEIPTQSSSNPQWSQGANTTASQWAVTMAVMGILSLFNLGNVATANGNSGQGVVAYFYK